MVASANQGGSGEYQHGAYHLGHLLEHDPVRGFDSERLHHELGKSRMVFQVLLKHHQSKHHEPTTNEQGGASSRRRGEDSPDTPGERQNPQQRERHQGSPRATKPVFTEEGYPLMNGADLVE